LKHIFYFLFVLLSFTLLQCAKAPDDIDTITEDLKVSFSSDKMQTVVGTVVQYTSTVSIAEENIVSWQWDFADGTSMSSSKNISHMFALAGSYLVKLKVTSKSGKKAEFSQRILVKNINLPDFGNLISIKQKISQLYPKVMVAAHRCYTANYPENSTNAITDAIKNNINIVEIDARLTSDNELVVMHDANTERTTNTNVNIAEKTWKELQQVKLKHKGIVTDYTIPTIKECLQTANGKVYVAIDASKLSSDFFYNKIYNTVASLNMVEMVIIYTPSPQAALFFMQMDKDLQILLGAGSPTDYNNATNINPQAALLHLASGTLLPQYTNGPTNNGIKFWANAYVNSADSPPLLGNDSVVENLITNQVSLIQTDYPIEIISYLKNKNLWLK
jgi:glycerophosphoryl diester phosphodiesterase